MKIKIIALILVMVSAFTFCSCGKKSALEPKDVVASFCDRLIAFDFDGMQNYISDGGENLKTAFNNENKLMGTIDDFFAENSKNTTYNISKAKIDEDTAIITVDYKYNDYNIMYREMIASMLLQSFSIDEKDLTDEKLRSLLVKTYKNFEYELPDTVITSAVIFTCVKVNKNNASAWVIKEWDGDIYNIMSQTFTSTVKSIGEPLV